MGNCILKGHDDAILSSKSSTTGTNSASPRVLSLADLAESSNIDDFAAGSADEKQVKSSTEPERQRVALFKEIQAVDEPGASATSKKVSRRATTFMKTPSSTKVKFADITTSKKAPFSTRKATAEMSAAPYEAIDNTPPPVLQTTSPKKNWSAIRHSIAVTKQLHVHHAPYDNSISLGHSRSPREDEEFHGEGLVFDDPHPASLPSTSTVAAAAAANAADSLTHIAEESTSIAMARSSSISSESSLTSSDAYLTPGIVRGTTYHHSSACNMAGEGGSTPSGSPQKYQERTRFLEFKRLRTLAEHELFEEVALCPGIILDELEYNDLHSVCVAIVKHRFGGSPLSRSGSNPNPTSPSPLSSPSRDEGEALSPTFNSDRLDVSSFASPLMVVSPASRKQERDQLPYGYDKSSTSPRLDSSGMMRPILPRQGTTLLPEQPQSASLSQPAVLSRSNWGSGRANPNLNPNLSSREGGDRLGLNTGSVPVSARGVRQRAPLMPPPPPSHSSSGTGNGNNVYYAEDFVSREEEDKRDMGKQVWNYGGAAAKDARNLVSKMVVGKDSLPGAQGQGQGQDGAMKPRRRESHWDTAISAAKAANKWKSSTSIGSGGKLKPRTVVAHKPVGGSSVSTGHGGWLSDVAGAQRAEHLRQQKLASIVSAKDRLRMKQGEAMEGVYTGESGIPGRTSGITSMSQRVKLKPSLSASTGGAAAAKTTYKVAPPGSRGRTSTRKKGASLSDVNNNNNNNNNNIINRVPIDVRNSQKKKGITSDGGAVGLFA